jgi:membrane-associated phospholipid phosphatase
LVAEISNITSPIMVDHLKGHAHPRLLERLIVMVFFFAPAAHAQQVSTPDGNCEKDRYGDCMSPLLRALQTVGDFVTAPIHWQSPQWVEFGGALAAIGLSHTIDARVREHFDGSGLDTRHPGSLQDALPATTLLVGTWGYAQVIDDEAGLHEAGSMLEATVLSVGATYVLNYAAGRRGPFETTNPNRWESGGNTFPSEHTSAAFAIGTVLAESGNDDHRWVRRVLGYGVAGFTMYERLSHNAHWLSDTVAGGALGIASAQFAMNRRNRSPSDTASNFDLTPLPRGFMLRYSAHLP